MTSATSPTSRGRGVGGALMVALFAMTVIVSGCGRGTDSAPSSVDPVAASRAAESERVSQSRVSAEQRAYDRRDATLTLCRQITTSVEAMITSFNAFVDLLNEVQTYDAVGDHDTETAQVLQTQSKKIRGALNRDVYAAVATPTRKFLDATNTLVQALGNEYRSGLNPGADTWELARDAMIRACSVA